MCECVTSSWRCHVTYVMMSNVHDGGQNALFLPLFVNVGVVFNIIEVVEFKNVEINLVTLTDDLEIWGQTSFNLTIHNKTCNYELWYRVDLGVYFDIYEVRDLIKTEINHLTLTFDLQNWGHKYILLFDLRISGCIYSKDKISVSILTFLRSRISKKENQLPDLDSWPWTSRSNLLLYDLSYLWLYKW